MEEVAMAAPQPKVWNFTSSMMPFSIFKKIFMMSPHFWFPTSPTPLASGISPTLWGFAKCSMTFALYNIREPSFLFYRFFPARSSSLHSCHTGDISRSRVTTFGTVSSV